MRKSHILTFFGLVLFFNLLFNPLEVSAVEASQAAQVWQKISEQHRQETQLRCLGDERIQTVADFLEQFRTYEGQIACANETRCTLVYMVTESLSWWQRVYRSAEVVQTVLHVDLSAGGDLKLLYCSVVR